MKTTSPNLHSQACSIAPPTKKKSRKKQKEKYTQVKRFSKIFCFVKVETIPSTDLRRQTWEQNHHGGGRLCNPPPRPTPILSMVVRKQNYQKKFLANVIFKLMTNLLLHWQLTRSSLEVKIMSVLFLKWCLMVITNKDGAIKGLNTPNMVDQCRMIQQTKLKTYHPLLKLCCSHSEICQPSTGIYLFLRWFSKRDSDCIT